MKRFITEESFKKAEKTAFDKNIPIRREVIKRSSPNGDMEIIDPCKVIKLVRPRAYNSHKGDFGKLIIIGGSDRYPGALQLSALSALRCGAGIVTAVTTNAAALALSSSVREATLYPLPSDGSGFISPDEHTGEIVSMIKSASAVLIGSGLGQGEGCKRLLELVLENSECPIILDADGINIASSRIECLRKRKAKALILTPHVGELARLSGASVSDVKYERFTYAKKIHRETGAVVVAKSSSTVVASDRFYLSVSGNCGLARGGSGDMLAGIISSFAAQGYSAETASIIGVSVSGLACERAVRKFGTRGVLPSDIIAELPGLFKKYGV